MFTCVPNASKVALAKLVEFVKTWDGGFIDCQMYTPHLKRHGAREVSRREFLARLASARDKEGCSGFWTDVSVPSAG